MFRPLKPYQIVIDIVVGVLFAALSVPIEAGTVGYMIANPDLALIGAVAVVVPFSVALMLRRLSPSLSLMLAWAGAAVQMGLGRPPNVADLAIFAVLYATAAYGSTRVYWAGLISALLGGVVIALYVTGGPLAAGGGLEWQTMPLVLVILIAASFALALSWTAGALVRSALRGKEISTAQRLAETEAAAEQSRVRIARDMHDVVAHSLAVVIAQADGARYAMAASYSERPGDADAVTALETISGTARAALADVRILLTQLRHSQVEGPQPTLADLETLYAQVRAAGVVLRVDVDPLPNAEVAAGVQLAVYRILQEAFTNALRHSAGAAVDVRLAWRPEQVELEVRNALESARGNVRSASRAASPATQGHGLIGMRERASLAGGRLDAGAEGDAFVVRAAIPIGSIA
ncbi:sensor histidine kinase (plasmid) [Coraliomargarita sp. W4R53]